jgi:peptide/nickel transport system permease protein
MTKFIIKRLLISIVILFFVMLIVYTLMYCMPTKYTETMARQLAKGQGATKSYKEWLQILNAQYGMDKGLIPGFFTWLKSAATGNFGDSWKWSIPVTEEFHQNDLVQLCPRPGGLHF